jgi:nucleotidyltransferase/DNA polymerase involved in DNA repair
METLREFTSDVEVYSIDEAFCDMSGFMHLNLDEYTTTSLINTAQKARWDRCQCIWDTPNCVSAIKQLEFIKYSYNDLVLRCF